MKKVFIFWIGDESQINENVAKLKKQGFDVFVGPTDDEHNFLMEDVPFYKNSFSIAKYAFCADVWRFWKLSKEEGIYIDASAKVGDDFESIWNEVSKYDSYFVREQYALIASCFLWNGKSENKIFIDIFNIYKTFNEKWPQVYNVSPNVLTKYLMQNFSIERGWDVSEINEKDNHIKINSIHFIRNKSTYIKNGKGSWLFPTNEEDAWQSMENEYDAKVISKNTVNDMNNYLSTNYNSPSPSMIRHAFEKTNSKEERRELIAIYKKISYKIPVSKKLIWSRLYKIFN